MFVEQTSFSSAVSEGVHSRIKLCMRLCVRFASTSGGIETGTVRMTLVYGDEGWRGSGEARRRYDAI